MKKLFIILCAALLNCAAVRCEEPVKTSTVTINVRGLRNGNGQVVAALFMSTEGFPAKFSLAYRKVTARIENGEAKVVFTEVPYGRYAAALGHDEDYSNTFEMAGNVPVDGYGASNNAVPVFGPPSFEYAAFKVNRPDIIMDSDIKYGSLASKRNFPKDREGLKKGDITVELDDFSSDYGLALVSLYAVADGFPYDFSKSAMASYSEIKKGIAQVVFKGVPYGKYAVLAFHDVNGNGKLDMDRGYPAEGVAASEDALHDYAPVLFNSAVFDLEEDNLAISADIKYDLKFPRNNLKTEPGNGGDLFLKVDGTEGDDGVLMAALFKSEDGFPSDYSRMAVAATAFIHNGEGTVVFKDLPFGSYAAAVYQDKDGNGKLNKSIFGKPTENYGFSMNKYGFMGTPPKYKDAEFSFIKDGQSLSITMH